MEMQQDRSHISNSGERVVEGDEPRMMREHTERYRFALRWIHPQDRVLDCACGSGYGAAILATKARSVLGVDLSPVAISYCNAKYARPGLRFQIGPAEELELADRSLDCMVSFETLEHVPNPQQLLAEARRVVKPGGYFLVSTPNRVASGLAAGERPQNPFHLAEWSLGEFQEMLQSKFRKVDFYVQRVRSKNKVHPMYVASKLRRLTGRPDLVAVKFTPELARTLERPDTWQPMIYVAVCRV